jgi:ATP/maltotriose-dependent transcriptional regulator MalT
MLVAPAGYGKTTLARQWLATRPHAWYRATSASADVAALAVGIAEAMGEFLPQGRDWLIDRLRASHDPVQELRPLAELQSDHLKSWPPETWLVVDEYELLAISAASEEYIRLLLELSPLRLFVTTRARPRWATARGRVYGDFILVDRSTLRMSSEEARSVLTRAGRKNVGQLVDVAAGWPAVLGLASLAASDRLLDHMPEMLYDYFAEELFHKSSLSLQEGLPKLALAPRILEDVPAVLFGPRKGPRLAKEALSMGFFSGSDDIASFHPLLRAFLLAKLERKSSEVDAAAASLVGYFLEHDEWDDAFDVIRQRPQPAALQKLIETAYESMLRSGRVATLSEWLDLAVELEIEMSLLSLIRAELTAREGNVAQAERMALHTAWTAEMRSIRFRAFCVAGRAAHLDNRESDSLNHFRAAGRLAQNDDEKREATWGSLLCAKVFDTGSQLHTALEDFLRFDPRSAEDVMRAANARLIVAVTVGGLAQAVDTALSILVSVRDSDPVIQTSLLNIVSRSLSLLGRYEQARELAERQIEVARNAKLGFVLPHAHLAEAVALLGLGDFSDAECALACAEEHARQIGDRHNIVDVLTVQAKLAVAKRTFSHAIGLTQDPGASFGLSAGMRAEYTATHALACASAGQLQEANQALASATETSSLPEVMSLIASARAIVSLKSKVPPSRVRDELAPVIDLGIVDPLVIACRGCPELGAVSAEAGLLRLHQGVGAAGRRSHRRGIGPALESLTPRERQVLELVGLGYTNKEIAGSLFIAEVTAKVHVRHILRKLAVRSRTEAAIALTTTLGPAARRMESRTEGDR